MRKGAITAVAHVLSLVCDETYDESIAWAGSSKRVTILNEDSRTDIKALTWSISNMARGGFRTADFWDMVNTKGLLSSLNDSNSCFYSIYQHLKHYQKLYSLIIGSSG